MIVFVGESLLILELQNAYYECNHWAEHIDEREPEGKYVPFAALYSSITLTSRRDHRRRRVRDEKTTSVDTMCGIRELR